MNVATHQEPRNTYRRKFNLTGLRVLDLRFKEENGEHWDFSRRHNR